MQKKNSNFKNVQVQQFRSPLTYTSVDKNYSCIISTICRPNIFTGFTYRYVRKKWRNVIANHNIFHIWKKKVQISSTNVKESLTTKLLLVRGASITELWVRAYSYKYRLWRGLGEEAFLFVNLWQTTHDTRVSSRTF